MDPVIGEIFSRMDLVTVKFIPRTPNKPSFRFAACITIGIIKIVLISINISIPRF